MSVHGTFLPCQLALEQCPLSRVRPADSSMRVCSILVRSGLPLEEFSIILSAKPIVISACRSSISRLQLHERFE